MTFTQTFYQVPKVYLIKFLEPGDLSSAQDIVGIIPVPEENDLDLHLEFESQGYWLDCVELHDLAVEGLNLLKELNIKDYDYRW